MSAESFIKDFLVYYFNPSFIVVGYDHHFGKNKSGNINTLKHYAATYSYKVDEISIQAIDELKISSTLIRQAIQTGEIDKANMLLGYAYFLQGTIIKGKQLGRTIGFPTANIALPKENKILPPKGVYVVTFIINGEETTYKGMLNIGVNPTVENTQDIKIEVHIFDFNKEIYGREVTISFKQKIRDEIKFADINALKAQLEEDKYVAISLN
ncbi:bifunctional riboflavin kinase/FMN adenylyltransferase-like [Rhinoderma darwinii]|uniref:bifunctional riboflavin kinase/FMN adenylyltransferase-like n=1 Tax=Rhinoderma darwinii TaxID=43563 RepID=UPI003F66F3E4